MKHLAVELAASQSNGLLGAVHPRPKNLGYSTIDALKMGQSGCVNVLRPKWAILSICYNLFGYCYGFNKSYYTIYGKVAGTLLFPVV